MHPCLLEEPQTDHYYLLVELSELSESACRDSVRITIILSA